MKAVAFYEHGGVDKLRYLEDFPEPQIKDEKEIIIDVGACALNHLDLWGRIGLPGVKIPLPHVPGSDVVGEVREVGNRVEGVRKGEKTLIYPGISCGTCVYCTSNRDSSCGEYKILGYQLNGGYAELVKVTERNIFPYPENLTYEEASAMPLVLLTAWHMLVTRARIEPGETVLVLSAGSGVGSSAIQIAKVFGATVITTVGEDWKVERAMGLGADFVINHRKSNLLEEVKKITNGAGVDIVIEHVGEATWESSLKALAPLGRLVTCGTTTGYRGVTDIRYVFSKQLSVLGSYMGSRSDLFHALRFVQDGKVKPVVDKVFNLREASQAQQRMEESKHFGKIVLRVP